MWRIAILAEGAFALRRAKTATGVIRYSTDQVLAVIDNTRAGQDTSTPHRTGNYTVLMVDSDYAAGKLTFSNFHILQSSADDRSAAVYSSPA